MKLVIGYLLTCWFTVNNSNAQVNRFFRKSKPSYTFIFTQKDSLKNKPRSSPMHIITHPLQVNKAVYYGMPVRRTENKTVRDISSVTDAVLYSLFSDNFCYRNPWYPPYR